MILSIQYGVVLDYIINVCVTSPSAAAASCLPCRSLSSDSGARWSLHREVLRHPVGLALLHEGGHALVQLLAARYGAEHRLVVHDAVALVHHSLDVRPGLRPGGSYLASGSERLLAEVLVRADPRDQPDAV